jgi:hypothetical protein
LFGVSLIFQPAVIKSLLTLSILVCEEDR